MSDIASNMNGLGLSDSHPTAERVALNSKSTNGVYHVPQIDPASASLASKLLQTNHDLYHIYFNESGFHNHIAHHLLSIYALGATPPQIQQAFDDNNRYQRPQFEIHNKIMQDFKSEGRNGLKQFFAANSKSTLGKTEQYFHDFEQFFASEIARDPNGWHGVIQSYMFKGDEVSEGMLTRMFAGFVHPIIHTSFGMEFNQPAIIVEGLAEAAVHDNWVSPFLLGAETKAAAAALSKTQDSKPLLELIRAARSNEKIKASPKSSDGNKMRDGVFVRAFDEIVDLASQYHVSPTEEELKYKTAEMININAYFAGAAAVENYSRNTKERNTSAVKPPRFDFFYMHCVNCSIFFSAILDLPDTAMTNANKARLLTMKARYDIAMYVSRGSPPLSPHHIGLIEHYKPQHPNQGWREIFNRSCSLDNEDGHTPKLIRALANGEVACKPYEGKDEHKESFPVRGEMWLKLGHMVIDSVEDSQKRGGPKWVRNTGFKEAWNQVPNWETENGGVSDGEARL